MSYVGKYLRLSEYLENAPDCSCLNALWNWVHEGSRSSSPIWKDKQSPSPTPSPSHFQGIGRPGILDPKPVTTRN